MKIAITGSIAYDYIMTFPGEFKNMLIQDSLDKISLSFLVDGMTKHQGGVAPNIAYSLALLGEQPKLIGTAGADFSEYGTFLSGVGVDISGVRVHPEDFTASFFVTTDCKNNQIAVFHTGAMAKAKELALMDAAHPDTDLVVVSPNDPDAMINYVRECKKLGVAYMYDPSQQVARVDGEQLAEGVDGASILILNEYEFEVLCKKTGFTRDDLMAKTGTLIITRGPEGADIYTPRQMFHVPVYPTENKVDPTGVGDAFRAGLLKGLASDWDWMLSGMVGSLAAAYVLEKTGTQSHFYTREEFVQRFRKHFDDDGRLDALIED